MGQQQIIFIVIGIFIVAIAFALGLYLFDFWSIKLNKDSMINDIYNISAYAYTYFMRLKVMGGGDGSYIGLNLPNEMQSNSNGDFIPIVGSDGNTVTFIATSRYGYGTITATLNNRGELGNFIYSGFFSR